jgi:hypothetical protein
MKKHLSTMRLLRLGAFSPQRGLNPVACSEPPTLRKYVQETGSPGSLPLARFLISRYRDGRPHIYKGCLCPPNMKLLFGCFGST